MSSPRKKAWPQPLPQAAAPIRYLTENGFSIVRLSEIDKSVRTSANGCRFLVQRDDGAQHEITVRFDRTIMVELLLRRRAPLNHDSMFWLVSAESCLANYLWEKDELPPDGLLSVTELSPDALMLALHWRDRN